MVAVIASATLWLLISLAFLLDALKAPRHLVQAGLALLGAEFVLLVSPPTALSAPADPVWASNT